MSNNDRGSHWKIGKPHRELCGARKKVLPRDVGRRTFWKVGKEKRLVEMSQPEILVGRSDTVQFGKCAGLSLGMQRYCWTMKQGEPTYSAQLRYLYKYTVGDDIHQCKSHKADRLHKRGVGSSAISMICCLL